MNRELIIGPSTLVPLSIIGIFFGAAFWLAGLSKDVAANASDIRAVKSERDILEAEILRQMRNQTETMAQIQAQASATDAKVSLLIKIVEPKKK